MTNDTASERQVAQITRANAGTRDTDPRRPSTRTTEPDEDRKRRTPTASERQAAAVLGRDLEDGDDDD